MTQSTYLPKPDENTPLVEQLRSEKKRYFKDFFLMEKAADEIERLTRELNDANGQIEWIKERVASVPSPRAKSATR